MNLQKYVNKLCFVGVSLSPAASSETGIAVLDKNLNLIRVDKLFNISDLESYISNIAPIDSMMVCVDMPKNINPVTGKWRQEARNINSFKLRANNNLKFNWADRFSNRGAEICDTLTEKGIEVYRYQCYYTKNTLKLSPPYKSRSPVACKYLQMVIQHTLGISGIPTNLIPLSALDAIIGAYNCWKIATTQENIGYKQIGAYKNIPVITAL